MPVDGKLLADVPKQWKCLPLAKGCPKHTAPANLWLRNHNFKTIYRYTSKAPLQGFPAFHLNFRMPQTHLTMNFSVSHKL